VLLRHKILAGALLVLVETVTAAAAMMLKSAGRAKRYTAIDALRGGGLSSRRL